MTVSTKTKSIIIALDAMGGDHGPSSVIPGAAKVLRKMKNVKFLVFGDENKIRPVLSRFKALQAVSTIIHTDKMVRSDEKPSAALRSGKGSSMRLAIEAVKNGEADAVVSAGNTGALMAMAKIVLRPLSGVHRPAIASVFPALNGETIMLDLGANVLVDAENLVQFAVLGSVFAKAHRGISIPSVGLLNVGTEETKGPDHVKSAAKILASIDFPGRYHGFVEGNDITVGTVDVVVSDGYAGNIALKAIEGVGKLSAVYFKGALRSDPLAVLGSILSIFAFRRLKRKIDPRLYNGGVFLGLNGICVKSHGASDALGFSSAVMLAAELVQHNYVEKVASEMSDVMNQETVLADGEAF